LPAFFSYFAVSYGYGKYVNDESVGAMDGDAPLPKVDLLLARKLLPGHIQDLRMKPFIILAFVTCCTVPVHAFVGSPNTYVMGIGAMNCAHWLSSKRNDAEGKVWIMGYWSSVNVVNVNNHLVGSHASSDEIFTETKKICVKEPSMPLGNAIARVYGNFEHTGR
jgi:hypothetical protein